MRQSFLKNAPLISAHARHSEIKSATLISPKTRHSFLKNATLKLEKCETHLAKSRHSYFYLHVLEPAKKRSVCIFMNIERRAPLLAARCSCRKRAYAHECFHLICSNLERIDKFRKIIFHARPQTIFRSWREPWSFELYYSSHCSLAHLSKYSK